MKPINEKILKYVEDNSEEEDYFDEIVQYINDKKIVEQKFDLNALLHLISKISNNHHQNRDFYPKIFIIIKTYANEIKGKLSNLSIFSIFKSNKKILLFLFKEKILIPDETIFYIIINGKYKEKYYYPHYFFPEFKSFYYEQLKKEIISIDTHLFDKNENDTFESKRINGQNDNYICQLIQNDSIEEFIVYVNKNNVNISSIIKPSIFETNLFLLKRESSLIEYASFYGSMQIIKYLFMNQIELKSTLWLYSIHSKNPELIHFLEENHVKQPIYNERNQCYKESIKCHHNDIANYIKDNFDVNKDLHYWTNFYSNIDGFAYYNFINLHEELQYEFNTIEKFNGQIDNIFFNSCKYDYIYIVYYILENTYYNINTVIITKICFFLIKFKIYFYAYSFNEHTLYYFDESEILVSTFIGFSFKIYIAPIHLAVEKGNVEIVKMLISKQDIDLNIQRIVSSLIVNPI